MSNGHEKIDTSDEACAMACMLVSNPQGELRSPGWQKRVNDLIRALRDERNCAAEAMEAYARRKVEPYAARIAELEMQVTAADGEIATLEAALEPFAREAWSYEPDESDDDQTLWGQIKITLGDLRRARAALAVSVGEASE